MTPEDYLKLAAEGAKKRGHIPVVDGDVDLANSSWRDKVRALPEAEILGNLNADGCAGLEEVRCSVRGNARLRGTGVREIGRGIRIGGALVARDCPRLRTVRGVFPGSVDLEGSGVSFLGPDFACGGTLRVDRCQSLRKLDCTVASDVFADGSSLAAFGDNFRCGRDLSLRECPNLLALGQMGRAPLNVYLGGGGIRKVLPSFSCQGDLHIDEGADLESLGGVFGGQVLVGGAPKLSSIQGLYARGSVSFKDCPLLETVEFSAGGGAYFHRCGMRGLMPSCAAAGYLDISECDELSEVGGKWGGEVELRKLRNLRRVRTDFACEGYFKAADLPRLDGLGGRVGGSARLISLGSLVELTRDFSVEGTLVLGGKGTALRLLSCSVGGDAYIEEAEELESTGVEFSAGGKVEFSGCGSLRVVRGRDGEGITFRMGTGIEKIGADFECGGDMTFSDCRQLKSLNCRVGGDIILNRSPLPQPGPALECGGNIVGSGLDGGGLRFSQRKAGAPGDRLTVRPGERVARHCRG